MSEHIKKVGIHETILTPREARRMLFERFNELFELHYSYDAVFHGSSKRSGNVFFCPGNTDVVSQALKEERAK